MCECPNCGNEDIREDPRTRYMVCGDCGVIVSTVNIDNSSSFATAETHVAIPSESFSKIQNTVLEHIRNHHPGVEDVCKVVLEKIPSKNICAGGRKMSLLWSAIAYIAYKIDGQCFSMQDLASDIETPLCTLSKEILRLEEFLDINVVIESEWNCLRKELFAALKSHVSPVQVRVVVKWCMGVFNKAMADRLYSFSNMPPSIQSSSLLLAYTNKNPGTGIHVDNKKSRAVIRGYKMINSFVDV